MSIAGYHLIGKNSVTLPVFTTLSTRNSISTNLISIILMLWTMSFRVPRGSLMPDAIFLSKPESGTSGYGLATIYGHIYGIF